MRPQAEFPAIKLRLRRGYLGQNEIHHLLTCFEDAEGTVQGGIPMTVQSESATSPLFYQPEAWRDPTAHRLSRAQAFILVQISRGKRAQRVGGWPPNPCR